MISEQEVTNLQVENRICKWQTTSEPTPTNSYSDTQVSTSDPSEARENKSLARSPSCTIAQCAGLQSHRSGRPLSHTRLKVICLKAKMLGAELVGLLPSAPSYRSQIDHTAPTKLQSATMETLSLVVHEACDFG